MTIDSKDRQPVPSPHGREVPPSLNEPPLRLWPGVAAVALLWLVRFGMPRFAPGTLGFGIVGGLLFGALVVVWWVFFSRAPRGERWAGFAWMAAAVTATYFLNHRSMGQVWLVSYAPATLFLAFVAWAAARRWIPARLRHVAMAAALLLACLPWTMLRTYGISGDGFADFDWRWATTPEEALLANVAESEAAGPIPTGEPVSAPADEPLDLPPDEPAGEPVGDPAGEPAGEPNGAPASEPTAPGVPEWPGFRGPGRDDVVPGLTLATDWQASPPVEVWRRKVGPGWSSFAVRGDLLYTQEQRGEEEVVSCYRLSTGEPVWTHADEARFWEVQGGLGPRSTPFLHGNRLYVLGATGILNALDAATGEEVWSRHVGEDTGTEVPEWGFAGSPLVFGDVLLVPAAGTLIAYDLASGEPRWTGPEAPVSYSSPRRARLGGVEQILMADEAGLRSLSPESGEVLWEHLWDGFRIVQPAVIEKGAADGDLLLASERHGIRRLAVERPGGRQGASWSVEERWTTNFLKPYFSDFVVHEGRAYGFDGSILAAVDLDDGSRLWKGGRYGHGQLLLLPDQNLLLVQTERGELALVSATPDAFNELALFPALDGKSWNHPVLIGDLLLMRNSEEMAAFRLPSD